MTQRNSDSQIICLVIVTNSCNNAYFNTLDEGMAGKGNVKKSKKVMVMSEAGKIEKEEQSRKQALRQLSLSAVLATSFS